MTPKSTPPKQPAAVACRPYQEQRCTEDRVQIRARSVVFVWDEPKPSINITPWNISHAACEEKNCDEAKSYCKKHENMFGGEEERLDFDFFDFSHGHAPHSSQAIIQVDDCDKYLQEHFVENVLLLILPIIEVNQHGSTRFEAILPALETNKTYLHCCLSITAIHITSNQNIQSKQIDGGIVRHRYATISEL